jgi:hypothetical protein
MKTKESALIMPIPETLCLVFVELDLSIAGQFHFTS